MYQLRSSKTRRHKLLMQRLGFENRPQGLPPQSRRYRRDRKSTSSRPSDIIDAHTSRFHSGARRQAIKAMQRREDRPQGLRPSTVYDEERQSRRYRRDDGSIEVRTEFPPSRWWGL
ncbi:uncharacterized protein STEHIDRAFT_116935 [Stereum hirsutum FP-91666 SS1]|uniref:uncharacterized protein n=1 Tax=Stereum hirsutum (strain FP-91666) TaxID=721885 RepID=UPI000440D422|nr:uncharacterized protein STEHIDRAFT_116935 [Stereum hirsutum FP-91666 SS1]EIM91798.1 hypothetical protein STEHIDRAFT_116935 [Stereum hirsutum FP-91666 SS1]